MLPAADASKLNSAAGAFTTEGCSETCACAAEEDRLKVVGAQKIDCNADSKDKIWIDCCLGAMTVAMTVAILGW